MSRSKWFFGQKVFKLYISVDNLPIDGTRVYELVAMPFSLNMKVYKYTVFG